MDEWKLWVGAIFIILLIIGAIAGFGLWVELNQCNAKTANIGYPHRWSLWGSCQIEVKEGQWIPLDRYYYKEPTQ